MARLDRLGPAREVAQLGATLGREFTYEVMQAVAPWDEATLQHELAQFVDAELLYQRGLPPQATYLFKHALIQEAAYQSLLQEHPAAVPSADRPGARRTVSRDRRDPARAAGASLHRGGPAGAGGALLAAGRPAGHSSARPTSRRSVTSPEGWRLLKTLPETPERVQQELTLQLALGAPLLMIKGYTAPEVEHAYTRALDLCQQVGDSPQRFAALVGLWRFYLTRASLQTSASNWQNSAFVLAQRIQDPALLQEAHLMLGSTFVLSGRIGLGAGAPGARDCPL